MHEKTWKDQPDAVLDATVEANIPARDGRCAEVRNAGKDRWFVTVGGLFESQTFHCDNASGAFRLLDSANGEEKLKTLPDGVAHILPDGMSHVRV